MIAVERPLLLLLVLGGAVAGIAYFELGDGDRNASQERSVIEYRGTPTAEIERKQAEYRRARPISNPTGFINADSVSIRRLLRNDTVVLVDFWTYSCINCQRTLPYLNAWHDKYADDGLVIIGVHAPEFEFEERRSNVEDAVARYGIEYPVVIDNAFATWNNYDNRFWPQKYLIDVDGFIRYEHVGEGRYARTERKIQELLLERANRTGTEPSPDLRSDPVDPDAAGANFGKIETPEIYFGAGRNDDHLGNGVAGETGVQNLTLPAPADRRANTVYLGGSWRFTKEYAATRTADNTIVLTYRAKEVNLVAHAPDGAAVSVTVNGSAPGEAAGEAIAADGTGRIENERRYTLVSHDEYGTRRLEITVQDPGLRAYTFTFG